MRHDLRARRIAAALLVGAAFTLGVGASGGAGAQEAEGPNISTLFSQADVRAAATGLDISYGFENFTVPTIAQVGVPLTRTQLTADPSATGIASLAYPGDLLANLGAVAEQSSPGSGSQIPKFPLIAEASAPSDKESASDANGGLRVETSTSGSLAVADLSSAAQAPGIDQVVRGASTRSSSQSLVEGEQVIARARTAMSDVSILNGLITIDSIKTELGAVSDGTKASTTGGTTVTGVRFLGFDAVLDTRGIRLAEAPEGGEEVPGGGLGGILGPVVDGLEPLTEQLSDLMEELTGEVSGNLNELLAQGGFSIRLLEPDEVVNGAQASRVSNGVLIESSFVGSEQDALVQLVDLVPPEMRGAIGPIPNPVSVLLETHITTMSIGAASVDVGASPPFVLPPIDVPNTPIDTPVDSGGQGPLDGGFESPLPDIADPGTSGDAPTIDGESASLVSEAVPAMLVVLLVLASPFFATGSSRLADNALAEVVSGCPEGLDAPPPPEA